MSPIWENTVLFCLLHFTHQKTAMSFTLTFRLLDYLLLSKDRNCFLERIKNNTLVKSFISTVNVQSEHNDKSYNTTSLHVNSEAVNYTLYLAISSISIKPTLTEKIK